MIDSARFSLALRVSIFRSDATIKLSSSYIRKAKR